MLAVLFAAIVSVSVTAQVTTSEIVGRVTNGQGQDVAGASVEATHVPSGTVWNTVTNEQGRFGLPGMRVGGPYTVKVTQAGFKEQTRENLQLSLGAGATVNFVLSTAIDEVVTVSNDAIFSEVRTGASTSISNDVIRTLPSVNGQISDFTRLTPQAGAGNTFAGQDNRLNNITVDGSYFNNSFGLAGQPGERTGVSPISLDAIEELQVNVAPYDVRQGNFVGAGINTVTKSGTNSFNGSIYYGFRKPGLVGKEAGPNPFNPGVFDFKKYGFRVGGPMPFFNFGENNGPAFISGKNKLFFFLSYESEALTSPGTNFLARTSTSVTPAGNTTRVLASDLDALSTYLATNFGYATGPYQGYSHATPAKKWLFRNDYNLNSNNRFSLRYVRLRSDTDVLLSNSTSLGFGNRRTNLFGLNFQNSNYKILENIDSTVGEWTSSFGNQVANSLIVGYTKQDESRDSPGSFFPFVDIVEAGSVYTSFGTEPFTPNNELRYNSFQIQDNLSYYRGSHTFAAGLSYERYKSQNVFFQASQSVYVYNSLTDFYTDANGYLANPNRTTSPVSHRLQVAWSNIPGLEKPVQPLKVAYVGFYGQDTWKVKDNVTLTYGLRVDVPFFAATGFTNPVANALTFKDEDGKAVQYQTQKLPDANLLWSPRFGVNWSPFESGRIQVRGGTGIFTARPAYVWISNQIGNNGMLTGFEDTTGTTRPFHPSPAKWKQPATGLPSASYALALTDPTFKFPQIWRSSAAVDVRVPLGLIAGAEYIYSKDVNGIYYINANLPAPTGAFTGPDARPRWTGTNSNRINPAISSAVVLKNQNIGKQWNLSFTLERPFSNGLYVKGAYSYGEARNTVDAGSIAAGSWQNNPHSNDPNNPGFGLSSATQKHRVFATASYSKDYFKFGGTTVSMFWERRVGGSGSYLFSSDMNGDGGTNDLVYIPRDISEMNFGSITTSAGVVTVTAAQQAAAWDSFISQDPYLSKNRGNYAERGAAYLPYVTRADFSVGQDLFFKVKNSVQKFQVRLDILNFGNLLNKNWGGAQSFTTSTPLVVTSTSGTATCRAVTPTTASTYCLRTTSGTNLIASSYTRNAFAADVYRIQIGFRYIFNK